MPINSETKGHSAQWYPDVLNGAPPLEVEGSSHAVDSGEVL